LRRHFSRLNPSSTQALAAVSHDLRTPIQRLRLRAGFLDDVEAQRSIDADLDEMEAMVEATLAFLRGDAGGEEPRTTDLAAILRTLCDEAADRGGAVHI
jgi:signal transduction histidine kinase